MVYQLFPQLNSEFGRFYAQMMLEDSLEESHRMEKNARPLLRTNHYRIVLQANHL